MPSPPGQAVVLVHGLWVSGWAMSPLARHLRGCGFRPYFFSYPSVRRSLRENARALRDFSDRLDASTVHYVGHSLGGVVIQAMLAYCPPARGGRVVTICSPHAGSRAAQSLARRPWGPRLLGASMAELLGGQIAPGDLSRRAVGVIKGTRPIGLGRLFADLPVSNDGVVLLEEACWPGAADEIVLPVSHSGALLSRRVAASVCQFLRFGHFVR